MEKLISLQLEKKAIAGLFQFPSLFSEIDSFIAPDVFQDEDGVHKVVYSVLRKVLGQVNPPTSLDATLISEEIKNLGVTFKGEISIYDYLNSITFSKTTAQVTLESFKGLHKLKVLRDLYKSSDKIRDFILNNISEPIDKIISGIDSINHENVNVYNNLVEPIDMFEGIVELVNERAKNPILETGIMTGFKEFDNLFGGVRSGNGLYAIVSRPKHGKSSWLRQLSQNMVQHNPDLKVLILDTEMTSVVSKLRTASALTGVGMWQLETGQWIKNSKYSELVTRNINTANNFKGRVYHMQVINKPIDEVCSIIRRWYYKYVGRNNKAVVVYDYLKMASEKVSGNWAEYQIIGDKINRLNDIGAQLDIAIWTAMQLNRSAEASAGGADDSAAISASDRLQWLCAFNGIFRRKTLDELGEDTLDFGTHKLIPLAQRFQGKDGNGHLDLVNVGTTSKKKYKQNFINYNIDNFKITEKGTLHDVIKKYREVHLEQDNEESGSLL